MVVKFASAFVLFHTKTERNVFQRVVVEFCGVTKAKLLINVIDEVTFIVSDNRLNGLSLQTLLIHYYNQQV
jgi:hypothetical protein